jgi:hypothetical protein
MKRFPICSVLAMKSETDSAVDGSLALADIFYAGGHRASSDALLIQTGLAPLIVEDRAAGDYFAPIPQGPLRQVGTTGLVNINAQESASSVVSLVLRSEPRLANMVLSPKDLGTLTASTVQTNETENEPLRHHLMTAGGQASTPGSLLDNLLGSKSGQGLLITVDRSNAPVASRSKLGRAVTGESMGRAFSNMTDAYLANRQGLASEPFFFMSIDLERGNHDKRFLSIPVRPDLPNRAPDGSVRQMDFIACNRSRDRLRPEYITYEKLGDNWFVRTTDKLTRVEMKPETIESKINDIITPYEEKITYLQLRKDLQENACLVKFSKV